MVLFHVDVLIVNSQFLICGIAAQTCCADSKVSERLAAYPFLRSFLRGRLVVLAPFPALFRSLRQRGSAPASSCSGQSNRGLICFCLCSWLFTCAEADVRVRVRGRIVSVHRKR